MLDTLGTTSSVPVGQSSYETTEPLRNNMDKWSAAITEGLEDTKAFTESTDAIYQLRNQFGTLIEDNL
jgi:hypothetical protein